MKCDAGFTFGRFYSDSKEFSSNYKAAQCWWQDLEKKSDDTQIPNSAPVAAK